MNLSIPLEAIYLIEAGLGDGWIGNLISRDSSSAKPTSSSESLRDPRSDVIDRRLSLYESVNLLGQVFKFVKSLSARQQTDLNGFTSLDENLQCLLGESLRNSVHSWEESCESIGLMIG